MAYNETVNVNVNANTDDASKSVERLENNIRTLDGAINLVGGSVEVLAGGLALSGALSEEQAEQFQTAAVGAIAFADGSKRAMEGIKTLSENTKIATMAQKAFGIATKIALGPIGLAIVAFGAIAAAVVFLKDKLEIANKVFNFFAGLVSKVADALGFAKTEAEKFREAQAELVDDREFELNLLKAQGAAIEDLIEKERELLQTKLNATKEGSEERMAAERELAIFEAKVITDRKAREEKEAQRRKDAREKEAAAKKKAREDDLKAAKEYREKLAAQEQKEYDEFVKREEKKREEEKKTQKARMDAALARQKAEKDAADAAIEAEKKAQEFKQMAIQDGIDNLQGALGALFGESKAVASANVLIDAAQAGVGIIKNSQSTGPLAIAYQATQFALLAATTAASLRQINSTEPGDTTAPGTPRPGGIPLPQVTGGTATVTPSTQSSTPPMRAYVVSGEVTSAQQAEAQINTRRTLNGG